MNISITSADREIMLFLFSSKKAIDIYTLYENFGLSPSHVSSFVNKYVPAKIVLLENEKISLTDSGMKWIIDNRRWLFLRQRLCAWKNVPSEWRV